MASDISETFTGTYELYDMTISAGTDILHSTSMSVNEKPYPSQTVSGTYELYNTELSANTDILHSTSGNVNEKPALEQTVQATYELYSMAISANTNILSSTTGSIILKPKPDGTFKGTYELDYSLNLIHLPSHPVLHTSPEEGYHMYDLYPKTINTNAFSDTDYDSFLRWSTAQDIDAFKLAEPQEPKNYFWRGYVFSVDVDYVKITEIFCGADYDPDSETFLWGLYELDDYNEEDPWGSIDVGSIVTNVDGDRMYGDCPSERRGAVSDHTSKKIEIDLDPSKYYLIAQGRDSGEGQHFDIEQIDVQSLVENHELLSHFAPDQEADYWDTMEPQQAFRWSTGDETIPQTAALSDSDDPEVYNTGPDISLQLDSTKVEINDRENPETEVTIKESQSELRAHFNQMLTSETKIPTNTALTDTFFVEFADLIEIRSEMTYRNLNLF